MIGRLCASTAAAAATSSALCSALLIVHISIAMVLEHHGSGRAARLSQNQHNPHAILA
jgi:hypothetical protein